MPSQSPSVRPTSLAQRFPFRLTYKQRDSRPAGHGTNAFVPSTGWNHNWFSYIRFSGATYDNGGAMAETFGDWTATVYLPDGGAWDFSAARNQQRDLKALLQSRYCATSTMGPYETGEGPFYPDVGSPGACSHRRSGPWRERRATGDGRNPGGCRPG